MYGIPFLFIVPLFALVLEKRNIALIAFSLPVFFFLYIFTLILITGMLQKCLPAVKPGKYPLNREGEVLKWMLLAGIHNFIRLAGLTKMVHANPVFRRLYYALCGAKIHTSVIISYESTLLDPFLIEIDEGSKIGEWTRIAGHFTSDQHFIIDRVKIGKCVQVGAGCIIGPGVELGDNAMLIAFSHVLPHTKIPPGELWGGTPARFKRRLFHSG